MPRLNYNDWKREAIRNLYEQFGEIPFQFHQIDGSPDHSSQIYALSIAGYVRKVDENRRGIIWQLTEEGIRRALSFQVPQGVPL